MDSIRPDLSTIKYLAFEGGGGKGLAFLGAIQALEELSPAPIPESAQIEESKFNSVLSSVIIEAQAPLIVISQPIAERSLYGVSGASAGAITAFMLAMGMSASTIEEEMNQVAPKLLKLGPYERNLFYANRFEFFFEDPNAYGNRQWSPTSQTKEFQNWPLIRLGLHQGLKVPLINQVLFGAGLLSQSVLAKRILNTDPGPDILGVLGHPRLADYLYSLILNRGVFAGFSTREYFAELMERYLFPKLDKKIFTSKKKSGSMVTFKDFFNMTGVDLVVTGTNVSKNRTAYFSVGFTPDFSVAEAVAISMSIPILFKPALIDGQVNLTATESYNESYRGLWVDGGMLNNYPLHAFDFTTRVQGLTFQNQTNSVGGFTVASPTDDEQPFNSSTAGFRLALKNNSKYNVADDFGDDQIGALGSYLGNLLETIIADSSDSQIRSVQEDRQTCKLDVTGLSLIDFAGPDIDELRREPETAAIKRTSIKIAKRDTLEFWK